MKTRLAVRGYAGKILVFEEQIEVDDPEDLEIIAERQMKQLLPYRKHLLEIEFLDEPDVNQRFFRFGTDPARMVRPIPIHRDGQST